MAKARMILRKVIEAYPMNAQAWMAMSEVVERREHAVDCLERALALEPGNAVARARISKLKSSGPTPEPRPAAAGPAAMPEGVEIAKQERPAARAGQPQMEGTGAQGRRTTLLERVGQTAQPRPRPTSGDGAGGKAGRPSSSVERVLVFLVGLTAVTLVCLLAFVLIRGIFPGGARATPTKEDVRAVLYENVRAANAEDLDRYMATIHSSSPSYATTESTLASAFETYDLTYELAQVEVLKQSDTEATISFVLTTRKVSGPAFRDNRVTGTMTLRKEGGLWKIYDQRISNIEYLD